MGNDICPDCHSTLFVTNERLNNGDEISLLFCDPCGYYSVYEKETDTVTVKSDHTCPQDLETYQHKRNNGDRIVFDYCPDCGFYSADDVLTHR